jgi:hypothetical protein
LIRSTEDLWRTAVAHPRCRMDQVGAR